MRTKGLFCGVLALFAAAMSPPSGAEMIYRFDPTLELLLMHDGDVFSSGLEEERSDEVGVVRAELPLSGQSERTTWALTYAPEAEFYSSYSDLNTLDHRAEATLNRIIGRRSSLELGGAYLDTSDAYSDLLEDEIITSRTSRQLVLGNALCTLGVSERAGLSFRYNFREMDYEDPQFTGYTSHEAGVAGDVAASLRTTLGLDYAYQYFDYPERGDYGTHNLLARLNTLLSDVDTLTVAGGVFLQDYRADESAGGDGADDDDTGFIGSIEWSREGRRVSIGAALSRQVRPSGGIGSSVLSHAVRLSFAATLGPLATLSLGGLMQRSEPTIAGDTGNVDTVRSSASLDWAVARRVGLRFFVDYLYQQFESGTQRDLSYPRAGASVVLRLSPRPQAQPSGG